MKSDIFATELSKFENEDIKISTEIVLNNLPDYFFEVPASSSGLYHPLCDLGIGGLVGHTKVVCRICEEYFRNKSFNRFNSRERDLIRMSLIIHDGFKNGIIDTTNTVTEHPLLIANYVEEISALLPISNEEVKTVSRLVSSHMGPWTKDRNGKEILPEPKKYDELFVHNCDYIASRRFFNIEFDDNELINDQRVKTKRLSTK